MRNNAEVAKQRHHISPKSRYYLCVLCTSEFSAVAFYSLTFMFSTHINFGLLNYYYYYDDDDDDDDDDDNDDKKREKVFT